MGTSAAGQEFRPDARGADRETLPADKIEPIGPLPPDHHVTLAPDRGQQA
jgi:hypothetical protein